jgi:hypothetical protein
MFQTTLDVVAVAVTEIPGTAAVAVFGPHLVCEIVAHIQTGSPTRPVEPSLGAIVICGPSKVIESTARLAISAGEGGMPAGAVPNHTSVSTYGDPGSPPGVAHQPV